MGCICKKVPKPEDDNIQLDGKGESCMDNGDEKKHDEKPEDLPNRETTVSHLDANTKVDDSNALDKSNVSGKSGGKGKKKGKKSTY